LESKAAAGEVTEDVAVSAGNPGSVGNALSVSAALAVQYTVAVESVSKR